MMTSHPLAAEVECNWLSVEVKRGTKVLQLAAVTQEESRVVEQYHNLRFL